MIVRRLPLRLIRGRPVEAGALLLLALVVSLLFTTAVVLRDTARAAVEQSVISAHAGFRFALQPQDPATAQLLDAEPGTHPVWDWNGVARAGAAELPVGVRAATGRAAELGVLVDGRFAARAGEATLTPAVAEALDLSVGDEVELAGDGPGGNSPATLTGIVVDPADRLAAEVVVAAAGDPAQAATWLTDSEEIAGEELLAALEDRRVGFRTVDVLAGEQPGTALRTLGTVMGALVPVAWVTSVLLLALLFLGLRRQNERTAEALRAAGMPQRSVLRLLLGTALVVVVGGAASGAAAAVGLMSLLRELPAAALGQVWPDLSLPWFLQLSYVLLLPLLVGAVVWYCTRLSLPLAGLSGSSAVRHAGAPVLGGGVLLYALVYLQVADVPLATAAGLLVLVGACLLLRQAVGLGQGTAARAVIGHNAGLLLGLSLVLVLVSFGSGLLASRSAVAAEVTELSTFRLQPGGSYLLYGVNERSSRLLQDAYRSLGGRATITYAIPDEQDIQLRSTSPALVGCVDRENLAQADSVITACGPRETNVPINGVALSEGTGGIEADRALVQDGEIGLLSYATATSDITATAVEPATVDPALGGLLPGAVVPAGSPAAQRYGLRPSGSYYLALVDFGELPPHSQARMRAVVGDLASTADVSEDPGPDHAGRRAQGRAAGIAGTALATFFVTAGGIAYLAGSRGLRQELAALGVPARNRRRFGLRVFGVVLVGQLLVVPTVFLTSWLQAARQGDLGGWEVVLPSLVATTLAGCFAFVVARTPGRG